MVNKKYLAGILAMALIFGVMSTGCNNQSVANQLFGVWEFFGIDDSDLPGSASTPFLATVSQLYLASHDRPERVRAIIGVKY